MRTALPVGMTHEWSEECTFNLFFSTLVLLGLCKQWRSRSEEANWSGSTLFIIQKVNLYQQPISSNLIGRKLEVGWHLAGPGLKACSIFHNSNLFSRLPIYLYKIITISEWNIGSGIWARSDIYIKHIKKIFYVNKEEALITKTRLSKKWKFSDKKTLIFFIFLLKTQIVGTH